VLAAAAACVTDPDSEDAPEAGAGGAGGSDAGGTGGGGTACPPATGGTGGPTTATTAVCTMPAKWLGVLPKPTPLVSVGRPVTTNSTDQASKDLIVDGKYHVKNGLLLTPVAGAPTWVAIDMGTIDGGTGYTTLLLGWQDVGYQDFGPSYYAQTDYKSATSPVGYLIKTSADSTDGNDGTWTTVATVTDNPVRTRTHRVPFAGMRWVRFEVTAAGQTSAGAARDVRLDEIELHDFSAIADGDLTDGWFLMGDSITKTTFDRNRGQNELDKLVPVQRPAYAPALVEAGNGGETLGHALRHLQNDQWLAYAEGLTFVTLAFGTNDSWGSTTPTSAKFEDTMRSIIALLLTAKRVPILPRIPWNTVGQNLDQFNAVIDKLQQEFELPCGPDLYGLVAAHPEYVQGTASVAANCTVTYSGDGVHPQSGTARTAINQAYVDAVLPLYPPL
jgi:lysophospholipase L1-like esterase